jgi:hypothetical protein
MEMKRNQPRMNTYKLDNELRTMANTWGPWLFSFSPPIFSFSSVCICVHLCASVANTLNSVPLLRLPMLRGFCLFYPCSSVANFSVFHLPQSNELGARHDHTS